MDRCASGLAHGNMSRQGCCSMRRKTGWKSNGPMCWRSRGRACGMREGRGMETPGPWKGWNSGPKILKDRPVYGEPFLRTALGFAPVNEMGVVFLFGAMAEKLGFIVTWIGTQYPDVEAFREVAPGRWQRVRVEVEFMSRNFLQHFHDPAGVRPDSVLGTQLAGLSAGGDCAERADYKPIRRRFPQMCADQKQSPLPQRTQRNTEGMRSADD